MDGERYREITVRLPWATPEGRCLLVNVGVYPWDHREITVSFCHLFPIHPSSVILSLILTCLWPKKKVGPGFQHLPSVDCNCRLEINSDLLDACSHLALVVLVLGSLTGWKQKLRESLSHHLSALTSSDLRFQILFTLGMWFDIKI